MTKKGYQKRLPTVLVPAPRAAPETLTSGSNATMPPAPSRPEAPPAPSRPEAPPAPMPDPGADQAPEPSASGPLLTGRVKVLLAAALLQGLLVGAAVVWRIVADEPGDRSADAPSYGTWPEAGTSRAVTQVRPDGVLEVTHWIHSTEPLDEITLMLPDGARGRPLEVSAVEVVADYRRAYGPAEPSIGPASYVVVDATHILVQYELSGAVEMSTSAPGRGLVTTTALEVSPTQQRDTRVVRSDAVLSLACAPTPTAALEPCGESDADDQWRVQLGEQEAGARVVAVVTVSG